MIRKTILLAVFFTLWVTGAYGNSPTRRLIIDTDISSDADDVGALAVVHTLAHKEPIDILAIMISSTDPWSPYTVGVINQYFGRLEIPVGVVAPGGVRHESSYTQIVAETENNLETRVTPSVQLYREILAGQPDRSVTIVTIGYLTNLEHLLVSGPDHYSQLNGIDLVRKKVKRLVTMGGDYPQGREWNFFQDAEAANKVVTHWPTEIIFVGYTIGLEVITGPKLSEADKSSPVRLAYKHHNNFQGRPSWDQLAVLFAATSEQKQAMLFTLSGPGINVVSADGSNTWRQSSGGSHYLIGFGEDPERIAELIESLMTGKYRQ